ncbi:DNA primase [Myroides sp.]|uniref:DNA primase n=1 Tax=Myroides sp. TaxID=1874736 RepID=UPI0028A915F6|nr:DNA primase [Myroides sp.]
MQQYQIIKEASLEKVRDADIYEVISHYAQLKKSGSSWTCNSPLTNEKTPSFHVNPVKNNWVCYSSNQGGDGLKFVMIKDSISFIEAVEKIASICNILLEYEEVSEEVKQKIDKKKKATDILEWASTQYSKALNTLADNHWAKEMIADRRFTEDTVRDFKIGYAGGSKMLTTPLIDQGLFSEGKDIGLINVKDGKSSDFFRERLMFPIVNERGEVVGFGGRASNEEAKKYAKYLNSRETDYYVKTKTIYGLYQAKKSIVSTGTAILMEGYTDVISAHQAGVTNAIATCGTALTKEQVLLIKRYARTVIVMRDNDYPKTTKALIDLTTEIATQKLITFSDKFTSINDLNCVEVARIVLSKLSESNEDQILYGQLDDRIRSVNPYDLGPGTKAAFSDIDMLLKYGLKVQICNLPIGEDPDTYSRQADLKKYIEDHVKDAFEWKTTKLKNMASSDADMISDSVNTVSKILFSIADDIKRGLYIKTAAKIFNISSKVINDNITQIKETLEAEIASAPKATEEQADELKLPAGANMDEYKKYGFVTVGNCYHFQGKGGFFKGTNFRIEPLYHLYGKMNNKRLCALHLEDGGQKIIEFESEDFIQRTRFQKKLIDEGNNTFKEHVGMNHFTLLANQILSDFSVSYEITTLGWQKNKKFFAYANCIYLNGNLKSISPYGTIELEEEEIKEQNEDIHSTNKYSSYYLPAFAMQNKDVDSDFDEYENDRCLVYKQSPISIQTWVTQMLEVYGKDKGSLAVAFNFASVFRDIYLDMYGFFPLMFLAGEKDSGKSKFADSCANFFTYKEGSFDLHNGSPVGFYRRLARIYNVPTVLEEFNDGLDEKIFQSIKGAFDGRGREIGKPSGDNRTVVTKVNRSLIITSQYLSSRDDNSITSRSIVMNFLKQTFTPERINSYNQLKAWELKGLTSLIVELIEHRDYIEENLISRFKAYQDKFKKDLAATEYQERVFNNYVALIAPLSLLQEKMYIPINLNELYEQFKENIIETSDLIVESEGLADFWKVLEYLQENNRMSDKVHYNIKSEHTIELAKRKDTQSTWESKVPVKVLYLNLKAVHQLYDKEVSSRSSPDVISEATIRNYIKSKKYFIGVKDSYRYGNKSTNAFVFNYDMMKRACLLNLDKEDNNSNDDFFDINDNGSETGII